MKGEAIQARRGATAEAIHSESVLDLRHAHRAFASPLEQGERIACRAGAQRRREVRGSTPTEAIRLQQPITLPLSQTHTLALTGAGASVSPKRRERGEATFASGVFKILSA
jgi:hypothetical protein